MVLRSLILILCLIESASAQVTSMDVEVARATKLAKTGHMREANELLKKTYRFDQPGSPVEAVVLHCRIEVKLKNYSQAKKAAQVAMTGMSPPDGGLLYCRTEAGIGLYTSTYESLSISERESAKNENLHLIEMLERANYDAEKVNVLKNYMTAFADRKTWYRHVSLTISIVSWEERPNFYSVTNSQSTKAVNLTPCVGAQYSYANSIYDWSGGLCYGLFGHTSVQIDDNNFDGGAKLQLLLGHARFLRKLTPSGSGFGIQGAVFNRTIDAKYADGTPTSASSIGYSASLVGRLSLSKMFFEFKGGTIFGDPSAVWEFAVGVPIF